MDRATKHTQIDTATSYQIECLIHNSPAALERVLRVIRVRGFALAEMNIAMIDGRYSANFILTGQRVVENLLSQLRKLIEVVEVTGEPIR